MKKTFTKAPYSYLKSILVTGLLLLNLFGASAQNNWTSRYPLPMHQLFDIAYGAGKYVAVGAASMIRTSTDGVTWTTQPTSLSEYGSLSSIIYVNGSFVAVGTAGVIVTSTDGVSWTKQNSGTNRNINSIAYSGTTYVAVGQLGIRLTSTDRINWTLKTDPTQTELNDILYYQGKFVAVGEKGRVRTSVDNGSTWAAGYVGNNETLLGVAVNKYGTFVAVGQRCTIAKSTNGDSWALNSNSSLDTKIWLQKVAANPKTGAFVAISNNAYVSLVSADGNFWGHAPVQTGSSQVFYGLRYLQNSFIATGGGATLRSTSDGLKWNSSTINYWQMSMKGAAYGNGRFVLVGDAPLDNGTTGLGAANLALTTTDGLNYTAGETVHIVGGARSFNDVAFGNGTFVAVGADAIIQTSNDGLKWSYSQVEFGKTLKSVAFGDNKFVAVGDNGLILYSYNGKNWKKSTSAAIYSYNSVAYANGLFVLVGPKGVLATSTDGNFWLYRYSGTKENLTGVTFGNGKWVAVGSNNTLLTSPTAMQWTVSHPAAGNPHFTDIVFGNTQFVITGMNGQIFLYTGNSPWQKANSNINKNLVGITYGNGLYLAVGSSGAIITSDLSPLITYPEDTDNPFGRLSAQQDSTATAEDISGTTFKALTYPNPVNDQFSVKVEGVNGEKVRLQFTDLAGHTLLDKVVNTDQSSYEENIPMAHRQTGIYLMRVSTSTQTQTLKILKQ